LSQSVSSAKIAATPSRDDIDRLMDMVVFSGAGNIAVVGLAKNSGKTVALNAIIKQAQTSGIRIGIASSGRDGEQLDAVTRLPKPRIEVERGALVATTERLAMSASTSLEPLMKTKYVTVLGRLIIYRANSPGVIEVASGNKASVVRSVTELMRHLGAELIVTDGAAGRRFSSAPSLADATILSTGAVVAPTLEGVVLRTAHAVEILTTPEWPDPHIESFDPGCLTNQDIVIISSSATGKHVEELKVKSVLVSAAEIVRQLPGPDSTIILGGALPGNLMSDLATGKKARGSTLVVRDATRILATHRDISLFKSRGGRIRVFRKINLQAITTNPVSPDGRMFDAETLLDAVGEAARHIPVVDVVAGKTRNLPGYHETTGDETEGDGVA
jgi:hypothetical protein